MCLRNQMYIYGNILSFMEYRLDNGPVDHDVAVEELKRWYAEIQ